MKATHKIICIMSKYVFFWNEKQNTVMFKEEGNFGVDGYTRARLIDEGWEIIPLKPMYMVNK